MNKPPSNMDIFSLNLDRPEMIFEELLRREGEEEEIRIALRDGRKLREAIYFTFSTPFGRITLRWMEEEFQNRSSLNLTGDGFKTEVREGMRLVYLLIKDALKRHEQERKEQDHGSTSPDNAPGLTNLLATWNASSLGDRPPGGPAK